MKRNNRQLLPDTRLWIYCFCGEVHEHRGAVSEHFIGNWFEAGHSFLFFDKEVDSLIRELVASNSHLHLIDRYAMTYEQWQGDNLTPFQVGRFHFFPPWTVPSHQTSQFPIVLDPGLVFGDGTHPTTRDCLMALDIVCSSARIETALDLGTGTGVLALVCAKLGASKVVAVDYTMLAARTARRNVELNSLTQSVMVVNGRAEDFTTIPVDLLVANLPYQAIKDLLASDGFFHSKWFILSGLLCREAEKITAMLKRQPVIIHRSWHHDAVWQTMLGEVCGEKGVG